jgi:hydroxyacylglutathione hydrolase
MLTIHQFACLRDNYGFLLHDAQSGETVCIDTPDAAVYLAEAAVKGWRITQIWNTHWHADHAGGNAAIKAATGCRILAPAGDAARIDGVDGVLAGGDTLQLGGYAVQVVDVGGHTAGHIAYHLPAAGVAFVGDSLFALGCGRMFEGTPEQFWASLMRLRALPPATMLYCAHEYTQANAAFACHADPDNTALGAYAAQVATRRGQGLPTVPFDLAGELACNPFLRADTPEVQARWCPPSHAHAGPAERSIATFAALREAKNSF